MSNRKPNSSKVNLIISATFHTVLVVGIFLLAAHQGMLGKKLQALTVIVPPKEVKKEPEQVKPKIVEQKPEQKPAETPKMAAAAPPPVQAAPPPPAADTAPAAAPAAVVLPSMDFQDGAVEVATASDPKQLYKMLIEGALRAHWARPEDMQDASFVADVELNIDPKGNITGSRLVKSSGDTRWDNSVKTAIATVKSLSHAPPKGFPSSFTARFDVQTEQGDSIQVSSR
jgi:TonB family protein